MLIDKIFEKISYEELKVIVRDYLKKEISKKTKNGLLEILLKEYRISKKKKEILLHILQNGKTIVTIYENKSKIDTKELKEIEEFELSTNNNMSIYTPSNNENILTRESFIVVNNMSFIFVIKKYLLSSDINLKHSKTIANSIVQNINRKYSVKDVISKNIPIKAFEHIKNKKLKSKTMFILKNKKIALFYAGHKISGEFITLGSNMHGSNANITKQMDDDLFTDTDKFETIKAFLSKHATDALIDYAIINLPDDIKDDISSTKVNILVNSTGKSYERFMFNFHKGSIQVLNLDFVLLDLLTIEEITRYLK